MNLRFPSLLNKEALTGFVIDIFRNLLAIYIIMLVINFLSPGCVKFYIDLDMLLYPLIVLGGAALLFYAQGYERSDTIEFETVRKWISCAFLGLLLIAALRSIPSLSLPQVGKTPLMAATVLLGGITFYLNRDKLGEIEEEARQDVSLSAEL